MREWSRRAATHPAVRRVVNDFSIQVATVNGYMKTAVTVDWDTINANRPAWNARWNKTIER